MIGWSSQDAMATERHHIFDGAKSVPRQKVLVDELIASHRGGLARTGNEIAGSSARVSSPVESSPRGLSKPLRRIVEANFRRGRKKSP
jgi:hypothetical protein